MNKKYFALLLALASFASQSSVFDSNESVLATLKDTPATKYELGLFKLENYVYLMSNKIADARIDNTKFKFQGATIREDNNKIQIVVTAIGRSKYLTKSQCKEAKASLAYPFNTNKMPYNMWDGLPEKSYKELQNDISLNVILMDKENSESTLNCQ